jgi:hypothetical protein
MSSSKKAVVFGLCGVFAFCAAAMTPSHHIRFESFAPAGTFGFGENPAVDGHAKIKFESSTGTTDILLQARNLLPNTTYSVLIDGSGAGGAFPNAFTTNTRGHGSWQFEDLLGQAASDTTVTIFRWDGDFEELFNVTEAEIRAVGEHEEAL